jgi:hypothetical protein
MLEGAQVGPGQQLQQQQGREVLLIGLAIFGAPCCAECSVLYSVCVPATVGGSIDTDRQQQQQQLKQGASCLCTHSSLLCCCCPCGD